MQALNCAKGGGKAVIVYNRASSGPCETLAGGAMVFPPGTELPPDFKCPSTAKYLPTVGLTYGQGSAIKALLDAKKAVTATVKVPPPEENAKVGRLGWRSRAGAARAGAAGLAQRAGAAGLVQQGLAQQGWRSRAGAARAGAAGLAQQGWARGLRLLCSSGCNWRPASTADWLL